MIARRTLCGAATALLSVLVAGCHHRAPVRAVIPPPPAPVSAGPVMVSVPPPTHRSTDAPDAIVTHSDIPVVKPVRPPKKSARRKEPVAPPVAAVSAPPALVPAPAPPPAAVAPRMGSGLGELTTSTDNPAATRDGAAQAIRRERDRIAAISRPVQAAHPAEMEQARRFVKSASESWNAADYAAALSLTTKARVLLDDLLQ